MIESPVYYLASNPSRREMWFCSCSRTPLSKRDSKVDVRPASGHYNRSDR